MNSGYQLFRKETSDCINQYSRLKYVEEKDGVPTVQGELILKNSQGEEIDSYKIRIVCSPDYPFRFPAVYETGGRIPPNIEWHVHSDQHACICSWPEELIICNQGITLNSFIEKQVIPYYFNQKHREMNGYFVKERAHGNEGNVEYFKEKFRTNNLKTIVRCLEYIKANPEPNRTNECFCRSGDKYRKCHRNEFREFKELSSQTLDLFIQIIKRSTSFWI